MNFLIQKNLESDFNFIKNPNLTKHFREGGGG